MRISDWSSDVCLPILAAVGELYLIQLRPIFAGDEQALPFRVPGDAVEHAVIARGAGVLPQPAQIDARTADPGLRVDADDRVGHPDIAPTLAVDRLAFGEHPDRKSTRLTSSH